MNIPIEKISFKSKICLSIAIAIMASFFFIQSLLVFKIIEPSYYYFLFGYACIILFAPPFFLFVKDFLDILSDSQKELLEELRTKNTYREHAAKILRHDMHSGVNIYIPRGVRSLVRRLGEERIKELRLESPLKLITEGLEHSQQVFEGIYQFTNLVRSDHQLEKECLDVRDVLLTYLKRTSYTDQVHVDNLGTACINESLFCTAIDNLIRNGLKYNDSSTKMVIIKMLNDTDLAIIDNGRGLTQEEFLNLSKPYTRKSNQKEQGTGLGLNICVAILKEHGFTISVDDVQKGTRIRIKIK